VIINLNIDTREDLSDNDKVVLLALAGEISLGEPRERPDYPVAAAHTPEQAPKETLGEAIDRAHEEHDAAEAALPDDDGAPAAEPEEKPKRARVVNVSDASLQKYDFHRTEDGEIVCDHCDHVSETGRALHLHAGTHSDVKEDAAPKEKALKAVKDEPEAGVDAVLSTEPDAQDTADAEKAAAGDPDPEPVAEVPAPVEAKVVDPKVLRDEVAKVATEMVAASKQADIRGVLDDLGVARVSMIDEKDLQAFLDAEPIAAFIAKKAG
jgi:hypothetical protein